jgi:hypothetical protein
MPQTKVDKRTHTLFTDYNNLDYYKFYKNNYKNTVDISTFRKVIKDLNTAIRHEIVDNNYDYKLPKRLGIITVRKFKKKIKTAPNKRVGYNLAPDWKATKKLWEEDEEARKNKILIRHENRHSNGFTFHIRYTKSIANFKNKSIYRFKPTRTMQRELANNIKENNLDAFLL